MFNSYNLIRIYYPEYMKNPNIPPEKQNEKIGMRN